MLLCHWRSFCLYILKQAQNWSLQMRQMRTLDLSLSLSLLEGSWQLKAPFQNFCLQNQNLIFKIDICFAKLQRKSDTLVGCVNNLERAPSQLGGRQEARTDSALAETSPGA